MKHVVPLLVVAVIACGTAAWGLAASPPDGTARVAERDAGTSVQARVSAAATGRAVLSPPALALTTAAETTVADDGVPQVFDLVAGTIGASVVGGLYVAASGHRPARVRVVR